MAILKDNEIRKRNTNKSTYIVIGDKVRQDLLAIIKALKTEPTPPKYNTNDDNALHSMDKWLKEDRDFNELQWLKFSKMLDKFELPNTLKELAKELDWEFGTNLNKSEMFKIMESRRQKKKDEKIKTVSDIPTIIDSKLNLSLFEGVR